VSGQFDCSADLRPRH